jgi:hypothetical protein
MERVSPVRGGMGAAMLGSGVGGRVDQGAAKTKGTVAHPVKAPPPRIPSSISLRRGVRKPQ